MKKVLIITYYWPPLSGPGVQRFLKFAKYLPSHGWEPIILTPQSGSSASTDDSLKEEVEGIRVYRTPTLEPFRVYNLLRGKSGKSVRVAVMMEEKKGFFHQLSLYIRANLFIPDARRGWNGFAKRQAAKMLRSENIDAVITTGPPHSSHLIGLYLKKAFKLPWIADLRDPWTNIYYNAFLPRTNRTKRIDKHLEDTIVSTADATTVVSPSLKEEFQSRSKRVEVIYNGFDAEDMPAVSAGQTSAQFTLAYIGNFKANQDAATLWRAIGHLREKSNVKIHLKLIGNVAPQVKASIESAGIGDLCTYRGFVPHQEATQEMASSNMLLFIVPQTPNNRLIITGKLFEYLASRVPLLCIGPTGGDAAKIIETNGKDKMIDYGAQQEIEQVLLAAHNQWKETGLLAKHSETSLQQYERRQLTGQLAGLLNDLTRHD